MKSNELSFCNNSIQKAVTSVAVFTKIKLMIENLGLNLLSYIFHPFLQEERDRKMWIEEQVKMLMKNINYER